MSYLIYNDYKRAIQSLNLMQVLGNDLTILQSWQLTAQEEAISFLIQKYNTEMEFTDTTVWDIAKVYQAADRVYLDADLYNAATVYGVGDLVRLPATAPLLGQVTICITAGATGTYDPAKFTILGNQYDLFYGSYPHPYFDINKFYNKGELVYYAGKVWTAVSSSGSGADSIQYGVYAAVPKGNYFPGDPRSTMWGTGVTYTIPAGTLPTNSTYYTKGDNRGAQILQKVMDITIFYIHQRISPQNIPNSRVDAYRMAIQWLRDASRGEVTPNLPLKQPNQGNRIRYGGNVRLNNHY